MAVTRSAKRRPENEATAPPTRPVVPKTADGHHIIVQGRRWRATDPLIPRDALADLKHHLGKSRSALGRKGMMSRTDEAQARKGVALAKLGLGERGKPEWWNDTASGRKARWEKALEELRRMRAPVTS